MDRPSPAETSFNTQTARWETWLNGLESVWIYDLEQQKKEKDMHNFVHHD